MSKPIVRGQGEGERRWFLGGGVHTWKATAAETGGAFFVFEDELEGGKTTPLHAHPDADEVVYVVEGEILLRTGQDEQKVSRGGTSFVPRGTEHAFVVTSATARLFCMQVPGSGDAFYRNASVAASQNESSGPVDFGRVRNAAAETGSTKILGPSPFAKRG
jgi:quercetin dioxygenase-like cupin family protein